MYAKPRELTRESRRRASALLNLARASSPEPFAKGPWYVLGVTAGTR
jgi:hypothetical protein